MKEKEQIEMVARKEKECEEMKKVKERLEK